MELMNCPGLAVPDDVMQHVVRVESSYNPYAIGVVGAKLARQPRNLAEALATARMLEDRGFNFSVGLAQVNRHNLARYGLDSYERAFEACPNLQAGSRILAECHRRSGGDWGKSFSCYYSGNFSTGYRHGYVQKIYASMRGAASSDEVSPIQLLPKATDKAAVASSVRQSAIAPADQPVAKRVPSTAPSRQDSRAFSPSVPFAATGEQTSRESPGAGLAATPIASAPVAGVGAQDHAFVF